MASQVRWLGPQWKAKFFRFLDRREEKMVEKITEDILRIVPYDTGKLSESIEDVRVKRNHYRIQSDVEYALFVEFGTSTTGPKPYFRPPLKKFRKL